MTRGPLPPGVYWRRRLFVLGLAAALVVVIAGALRGGSDGSSGVDPSGVAEQVAGSPSSTDDEQDEPGDRGRSTGPKKNGQTAPTKPAAPTSTPPPAPTGRCADDDILVRPVVDQAIAGGEVTIVLELRTRTAEACTWEVSSRRVTLKVTSGSDDIWASRQCPRSVPAKEVVVRQDSTVRVGVVWHGRRSDEGCTRLTDWAMPGYYHVAAAPLGGEPAEVQFRLDAPSPEVITRSPDPKPDKKNKKNKNQASPDRPGRED